MTNLTADRNLPQRMTKRFGYGLKAGVKLFRGSLVAVTSAGLAVKPGDVGAAAVVGLSPSLIDNTSGADSALVVEPQRGIFPLTVPSATHAHIGATVYCTDDNVLTLTASTNLPVGILAGIEASQTYVEL
jgi:hypothetical protein